MLESNAFRIKLKDYLAYVLHYRFIKPTYSRLMMWGISVLALALSGFFFVSGLRQGMDVAILRVSIVLSAFLAWMLLLNIVFPALGYWNIRRNGSYASNCRISINEDQVETVDAHSDMRKKWTGIEQVMETKSHILIYFNRCNAFVVPKSAFSTPQDAQAFRQNAEAFLDASKASASSD